MPEPIDSERYNQAVMQASILEWVMDALDGKEVCDFAESFPEVERAKQFRHALWWIATNLSGACPDLKCEGCKMTIQEAIYLAKHSIGA